MPIQRAVRLAIVIALVSTGIQAVGLVAQQLPEALAAPSDIALVQYGTTGTGTSCPQGSGRTALLFQQVTAGNLLVVVAAAKGGGNINLRVANPAGFTKLDGSPPGSTEAAVFYKIADGTETYVNVGGDDSFSQINLWVGEYSGVDTANPVDVWTSNGKEGVNAVSNIYTGATDEPGYKNGLYLYAFAIFNAESYAIPVRFAGVHDAALLDDAHCRPAATSSSSRTLVYDAIGTDGYQDTAHAHLYFGHSGAKHIRAWAIVFKANDAAAAGTPAAAGGTSAAEQVRGDISSSVTSRSLSWVPSPAAGRRLIASVRTVANVSGVTHSAPPGWTEVGATQEIRVRDFGAQYVADSVWTKTANGNETTETWTFSQQVPYGQIIGAAYSGIGNINGEKLFDAHLGHYFHPSTTAEAATPRGRANADTVNFAFLSTDNSTGAISLLTNGWVVDGSVGGGNFGRFWILRKNTSTEGDIATRVEFSYGSSTRVGELIAFSILSAQNVPDGQTYGSCGGGVEAVNPSACLSDPVNTRTGSFTTSVTDLALPGIGVPLAFTRSYTSADTIQGPMGIGWTHSFAPSLSVKGNGDVTLRSGNGQQVRYIRRSNGTFKGDPGSRSTLVAVSGGYELTRMDQTVYAFDSQGRLTALRDRNANELTLAYGGDSLPDTITDTAGRTITLSHNGSGKLTGITLPDGRSVAYTYNSGRLASVTDLRGKTTTYAYNASDQLTEITDPNGHRVIKNTYSGGRVVEQEDAMGEVSTFSWDEATETATMTDARGKEWKDVYDGGRLVKRIDPLGGTTEYAYDADLNVTTLTDPPGKSWSMTYDGRGNLLSRTAPAPLSHTESFTYDSTNNLTSATDGRGNTTTYAYDGDGNLTTATASGSTVTAFGRNAAGELTSLTDPRGKVTTFDYDGDGNLTEVLTPLGNKTTMGYDSSGRMTSRVEPRGNASGATPADYRWTYAYDDAGHPTTVTDPLGNTNTFIYDDAGNLTARTDAKNRRTVFSYNAANELTQVAAPDTTTTSYDYDESGHLASRTDAKGHTTTYRYDDVGRLLEVADPLGSQWTYHYDAGGNLIEAITAAGNATPASDDGTITYSYDAASRLTGIDYSDATPDVTFAYDANGNLTRMADGVGTETRNYDALDRLTGVTRGSDTFSYAYDAGSNLTRRTYPDGTVVDLGYDDDSRMASVTSGGGNTTYAYDHAGNLTFTAFPNGTSETHAYDRAGRLTTVAHSGGVGASSSFAYTLDQVGNPTQVTTPEGTTTYTYDSLDRLTTACFATPCPAGPDLSYAYDTVGNRTSETRSTGTTTYAYNVGDQLTSTTGSLGTTSFAYDANGNQTASGGRSFAYDLANRMTSTTGGGATTTYTYDGAGKRLSRAAGSEVTSYLWDPNHSLPELAMEREGSGSLLRRYVHGNDLVSLATGGQSYFYQHDGLGSVVGLTSSSGTRPSSHRYEPYGAERPSAGGLPIPVVSPTSPMRFTGELFDQDTGLYHLRAREYDPTTGRFLSRDPLTPPMSEPGVSSYAYANNRPTVLVDPSGMRGEGPSSYIGPTVGSCPNIAFAGLIALGWNPPDYSLNGFDSAPFVAQTQCIRVTRTEQLVQSQISLDSGAILILLAKAQEKQLSPEEQQALDDKQNGRPFDAKALNRALRKLVHNEKIRGERNIQRRGG
jgi:RHS repeat-associated protein